jgi:Peptidase family M23
VSTVDVEFQSEAAPIMANLIVAQIVFPLLLVLWLALTAPASWLGFSMQAFVSAISLFAIARMGVWVFPPWWTPYLYGLLFVIALVVGVRRHWPRRKFPSRWLGWTAVISWAVFGVFVGNEAIQTWRGQVPPAVPVVDLAFPLRGGTYLILNGGSDIRVNAHLKTLDQSVPRFRAYRGQSYGLDVIQINPLGLRSAGIVPRDPAAYLIYGEPVLAPCSGTILQAVDGLPDMPIPELDVEHRAGNHVLLRCREADVLLAHFRPQSLVVQTGMQIAVGEPIAEAGNSGASDEPHLHLHAQRPGSSAEPFSGDPLPIRSNGRFLIRNDRVTLPSVQEQ